MSSRHLELQYFSSAQAYQTVDVLCCGCHMQAKPDATVEVQISENMQDVQFDFYK